MSEGSGSAGTVSSGTLRATDIGVTVLALSFLALRFFARWLKGVGYWWDDYLILVVGILSFASLAVHLMFIEYGLGKQAKDLPLANILMIEKLLFITEISYLVNISMNKVAVLLMYCRIFPRRSIRVAAWILSILTAIWMLTFLFRIIFQCQPIQRAWDSTVPGTCADLRVPFLANTISNVAVDVAILALPVRPVWKLRLRFTQKLTISGIFLLGWFVVVASTYRLVVASDIDRNNISATLTRPSKWAYIEICTGIISACLPTLRPLVMTCVNKLESSFSGRDPKCSNSQISSARFRERLRETLLAVAGDETDFGITVPGQILVDDDGQQTQNSSELDHQSSSFSGEIIGGSKADASTDQILFMQDNVTTNRDVNETQRSQRDEVQEFKASMG